MLCSKGMCTGFMKYGNGSEKCVGCHLKGVWMRWLQSLSKILHFLETCVSMSSVIGQLDGLFEDRSARVKKSLQVDCHWPQQIINFYSTMIYCCPSIDKYDFNCKYNNWLQQLSIESNDFELSSFVFDPYQSTILTNWMPHRQITSLMHTKAS